MKRRPFYVRTSLTGICIGFVAALFAGQAQAVGTAKPVSARQLLVPKSVAEQLVRRQEAGWKLTEVGKLIAARVPVEVTATTGMELLATTDDAALASPQASPASVTNASPTAQSGAAKSPNSQKARCLPSSKRYRSLAMTAGTGMICSWGQRGNAQWTSQYGYSTTRWTYRDVTFSFHTKVTGGMCSEQGCFWYSFTLPPSDWEVVFVEVESPIYARIDYTWCG